jgi:1-deoxy-D-xylulose-5-phosphate reductoisomerase
MNKGLEVIEAHWLFGLPVDQIQVVIHPQSILHSGVAFVDGSVLFQAGTPDMRVPIQYALAYPDRWPMPFSNCHLDMFQLPPLQFEPPDHDRFPCLALACEAGRQGGAYPVALNAANEVAVDAFLNERIPFGAIHRIIAHGLEALSQAGFSSRPGIEEIMAIDAWSRQIATATL